MIGSKVSAAAAEGERDETRDSDANPMVGPTGLGLGDHLAVIAAHEHKLGVCATAAGTA
jgi:hypothetical protein